IQWAILIYRLMLIMQKNPGTLPSKCTGKAIGIRNNVPTNVLRLLWLYYKLCDNLRALPLQRFYSLQALSLFTKHLRKE
ncbi:hypothetical protein, partial [Phascolarctobacterium succinatutens]|uniref:hypothetical protein n=1 Tax=Phascolarctobacterium succinatutens TaxID=626940 RepID=UPI0026F29C65